MTRRGRSRHRVAAVLKQLAPGARLLVVADNCSDATAAEARAAGAEVIERQDPARGKGHALAFGVAHLAADPPQVVLVIDADCTPAPGALNLLAATVVDSRRPVQALNLMLAPPGSSLRVRMAAFAWAMHNQVRPFGMHRLGLPCQLMGTGMAFPWTCVAGAEFASGHLAEDQQLGLKLAAAGHAPRLCPGPWWRAGFRWQTAALEGQRKRWEHGHLSLVAGVPPLLWRALRTRNAAALALAVDLCIPPLALLALLLLVSCGFAWMAGEGAWRWPRRRYGGARVAGFRRAVLLAWSSVGRRWVRLSELASLPLRAQEVARVCGLPVRRQKEWVRTTRSVDAAIIRFSHRRVRDAPCKHASADPHQAGHHPAAQQHHGSAGRTLDGLVVVGLCYLLITHHIGALTAHYTVFVFLLLCTLGPVYNSFGIYRKNMTFTRKALDLFQAWTLTFSILIALGFLTKQSETFSRLLLGQLFVSATCTRCLLHLSCASVFKEVLRRSAELDRDHRGNRAHRRVPGPAHPAQRVAGADGGRLVSLPQAEGGPEPEAQRLTFGPTSVFSGGSTQLVDLIDSTRCAPSTSRSRSMHRTSSRACTSACWTSTSRCTGCRTSSRCRW
jgi:hypothetical protein